MFSYRKFIASTFIFIEFFIFSSKIIAQEKVPLNYREIDNYNCRNAIETAKNKLKSYDLNVYTMRLKTSDFYENVPNGKIISFWLEGNASDSILVSEKLMLSLSKQIISNCSNDNIDLVEFAVYGTGYSQAFGLFNGEVQLFEIVTPPDCKRIWGTNCNT